MGPDNRNKNQKKSDLRGNTQYLRAVLDYLVRSGRSFRSISTHEKSQIFKKNPKFSKKSQISKNDKFSS